MANVDPVTKTAYADLDWENYIQSRPRYPESLKNLIYTYRKAHSNATWGKLVDVGGGVGISSTLFASDFDIVHLLDPSPANHENARKFLGQWVEDHNLHTKLEYTEATAERGSELVRDADLVICAQTAHWIDPDRLASFAASMLRPGGTLAIWTYWNPLFPDASKSFGQEFAKAVNRNMALCLRPDDDSTASAMCAATARVTAGSGMLDSIAVPKEHFDNVQRVHINPKADAAMEFYKGSFPLSYEPVPSRVSSRETELMYESLKDPEADGWIFRVGNKWLHDFTATLRPADIKLSSEQYATIYGDLDRVFANECPSGSTSALWAVSVILATKRLV